MAAANLDFQVPAHLQKEFVFQTAGILPPNGIFFGFNTIKKVGEQAKKLGGKQVLLVTDEIMVQLGLCRFGEGPSGKRRDQSRHFREGGPRTPHGDRGPSL